MDAPEPDALNTAARLQSALRESGVKADDVSSIPLRKSHTDVGLLAELTTEVMQWQARALGIDLRVRVENAVPDSVDLDRDKVAWAITSLVGSGLRHVRAPGGSVTVSVSCDVERSTVSIAIRDDGPGIPSNRLQRLLTRDALRPGGALALLLIEEIAVAHGGGVEITSRTDRLDHFTEVRFTIPVERDVPGAPPPQREGR